METKDIRIFRNVDNRSRKRHIQEELNPPMVFEFKACCQRSYD